MADLYDAAVSYVDTKLDTLFAGLERQGVLDDTVVILLGDHGQCLGEHDYWGHGTFLYDELIRVPLIVSGLPDTIEANSSKPVSLMDVP